MTSTESTTPEVAEEPRITPDTTEPPQTVPEFTPIAPEEVEVTAPKWVVLSWGHA